MPAGAEAEARPFYKAALGMVELPKPEAMRASGGIWFRGGDTELHLGVEKGFVPARKAHPALEVDNLDGFAERLGRLGFAVDFDDRYPGIRRLFTEDPFGNRIELLQR